MNFYVYYRDYKYVIFDRTCGTQAGAEERVALLRKKYSDAWWSTKPSPGAF